MSESSKERQESIARAEMLYTQTVLATHLIIAGTVSIWNKLDTDISWRARITNFCVLAICAYFVYTSHTKAMDARAKWKELTLEN